MCTTHARRDCYLANIKLEVGDPFSVRFEHEVVHHSVLQKDTVAVADLSGVGTIMCVLTSSNPNPSDSYLSVHGEQFSLRMAGGKEPWKIDDPVVKHVRVSMMSK